SRWPRRQERVVRPDGAAPNDDRVHAAAQSVHPTSRSLAADPFGIAGPGGDLAVEAHRPLGMNVGPAGTERLEVRRVETARLGVGAAEPLMPTFTDKLPIAHDHGANQRVGLDIAPAELRQLQRPLHPALVYVVHARVTFVAAVLVYRKERAALCANLRPTPSL